MSSTESPVKRWFGPHFYQLHPDLQRLHHQGGRLTGEVSVKYGKGINGLLARRLCKRLGIPGEGDHKFLVSISHRDGAMIWQRKFDDKDEMVSVFTPSGTWEDGYWSEKTGKIELRLTVDIKDAGWFWRCVGVRISGIPVPLWLFPETSAYKLVKDGVYKFFVGFRMPLIGFLLSYQGRLIPEFYDFTPENSKPENQ